MLRPLVSLLLAFTLLTGVAYPALVTGAAAALSPAAAQGSLIVADGRVVGSSLIGRPFSGPEWFWPRPSAIGYDAHTSGGSNLGPLHPALREAVVGRLATVGPGAPVDLVTTSASGLDPHLSPAAAAWQVERVAAARGLSVAEVQALVDAHTEGRTFGILGAPRVNVLQLNLALAAR